MYGRRHLYHVAHGEIVMGTYTGYYVKSGHPLKQQLEEAVTRLTEGGIPAVIQERSTF